MAKDISQWPLLVLMEHVDEWVSAARDRYFWRDMTEHRMWADRLREEAKRIIVWLELKGQDEAAARLDEEMGKLRQAMWNLQEACANVFPPGKPRCEDAREAMIDKAEKVAGAAEDLDQEVPEEAWEGFLDD